MGGGAPVLRQGRQVAVVVRDETGNGVGLLIAGVRRFVGRYFELEKLPQRQWRFGENLGVDSGWRNSRPIKCCWMRPVVQGVSW
jgi:hypothetical protein